MKNTANDLYNQDEHTKTEEACQCLALDPLDSGLNILLGICLERQKKYDEAISHYQKRIEISTDDDEVACAHSRIAAINLYINSGEWEKAKENHEAVIGLSDEQKTADNFCHLCFVYEESKRLCQS